MPPRRPADDDLPVSLDLDALEREGAPEPFVVQLGGRAFRLIDPQELPWGKLTTLSLRPGDILPAVVRDEDREAFHDALEPLPAWKVNRLADDYLKHHGLPSSGESRALPTS